ncbi:hypothetical protein PCO31110_02443 [Pandoraea communis]|uniref:Uncharacterized protein n=1 Tax=Pandoraea communis TaxID=2508297 RepID=A0A5E4V3X6_9BURK|nr:hypothetical protein PCO31110_02443 [Pandoraea communis]
MLSLSSRTVHPSNANASGLFFQSRKQAVETVLNIVEHSFEALRTTVVWVGYFSGVVTRCKVHQAHDLVTILNRTTCREKCCGGAVMACVYS